jgi:hypothetical protein
MRSNEVSDFTLTRETQMQLLSAYLGPELGPGLHGCKSVGARIFATIQLLVFLGSFLACVCPQQANAELLLYIRETRVGTPDIVNAIRIQDQDTAYDDDEDIDFISVDIETLNGIDFLTGRWEFTEFLQAFSTLTTNLGTGLPEQVVNIEFGVTKRTSDNSRLEVLATYKGSNGNSNPTSIQMFGGGLTTQADPGVTFVGSFSHDASKEFYTNGYVPESTATDFVFVFQPEIEADTVYQIFDNGSEPSMPIDGDSTYSLTFGVRIDSLGSNQNFTTASGLTYILPEPASMVTWAAVVGLAGFTAKRRRRNCDK